MAFKAFIVAAAFANFASAQQEPIYVPFEWNRKPASAVSLGSSGGTTTYGIIDGPSTVRTPGPGTLFQSAGGASMHWVNSASKDPTTLTGVCDLMTPVAVCTLNVMEGGGRSNAAVSGTPTGGSSTGIIAMMTTLALGFCIALAILR